MKPTIKLVIEFKKQRDNNVLLKMLEQVYYQGYSDGSKEELIFDDKRKFFHVRDDIRYEITCPDCGSVLVLDMKDLLKQQSEEEG